MDYWDTPNHLFISMTPPVDVIPKWMINKTILHLMDGSTWMGEQDRKIVCYDFDPYCFAPYIDGCHGHLAYGRLGLPKLKSTLTKSRDDTEISRALNTLCDLLHDPEKAAEAMRLNIMFQLRRLLDHDYWYIRQRSAYALKVLSGQQTGRLRVVNDERLMEKIINRMTDPRPAVRRTIYDLIHRLTTYYFAVPKMLEHEFIKLIMVTLRENFLQEEVEEEEEEDVAESENITVGSTKEILVAGSSTKSIKAESKLGSVIIEETEDMEEEEKEDDDDEPVLVTEESEVSEECVVDDKNICVLATLLDALVNLMGFSREATLDAICYDAVELKRFFAHEHPRIRILTWNVFKQMFTTDVGQDLLIPHNVMEDMMRAFNEDMSPEEFEELTGTLMLALIKVENRLEALKWGVLDKVLALAKQPSLSTGKRLAALNVLSHLAELPGIREMLHSHLVDVAIAIKMDSPDVEHHVETHIERVLWKP